MAKGVIAAGGGGGTGSDDLTAILGDVLKGKTAVTSDSNDEIGVGTLELTGNADGADVINGKTFYNTNAKSKQTGNMAEYGGLTKAASHWSGNGNVYFSFARGAYRTLAPGDSNYAQVYRTAAELGITGGKILEGQSILGIPGEIPKMSGSTITPSGSQQTIDCAGKYMTGNVVVKAISTGLYSVELISPDQVTADDNYSGTIYNFGSSGWDYAIVTGLARVGSSSGTEFEYSLGFIRNPSKDFIERLRGESSSGFVTFTMSAAGILSFKNSMSGGFHSNLKIYKFVKKY